MKEYVVCFIFTTCLENVWLISKIKPEWQKGSLNGIGGKVEYNETYKQAAEREIKEEAGVDISNLIDIGYMEGINNDNNKFKVEVFTAIYDKPLNTMEDEVIFKYPLNDIKKFKLVENVPLLIETCIYRLNSNSNFKNIILNY